MNGFGSGQYVTRGVTLMSEGMGVIGIILGSLLIILVTALIVLTVLHIIRLVSHKGCPPVPPGMPVNCPPNRLGNIQGTASADLGAAVSVLNTRLAKGEISQEEYIKLKDQLFHP
ncbi:MAG TPA: SHOCT domain-containing protein [Clostridia bacterium]|nr:SHOCT domain-containing protein [Clostridia bacterium]